MKKEIFNGKINSLILVCFFTLFLLLSIGYSAFSQKLFLSGDVSLNSFKDIRVTNIVFKSSTSGGTEVYNAKYNSNTVTTSIQLPNIDSTITYSVIIENLSDRNMKVTKILNEIQNNEAIGYKIIGLNVEDIINARTATTFQIVFSYKTDVLPENKNLSNIIKFEFAEASAPIYREKILNGAYPVFEKGLIPIIIDNNGVTKIADVYTDWYSYAEKRWANVIVPLDYEKYANSSPGTVIDSKDIVAYLVWIPRYQYQEFGSDSESVIDIKFLPKDVNAQEGYRVPEAFHLNRKGTNHELSGFWMSKFQVSSNPDVAIVMSIPSVEVLRSTSFKSYYEYGVSSNDQFLYNNPNSFLHVVKNSEWGAVAYLGNSIYGFCDKTTCTLPNRNATFETGRYNASNDYKSSLGQSTSTTLNVYGVYDMVGCAQEMTLGTNDVKIIGVPDIESMYYDDYLNSEYFYGDATVETKNWYGNIIPTLGTGYNMRLFVRGGNRYENNNIFFVKLDSGSGGVNNATRYTLSIIES